MIAGFNIIEDGVFKVEDEPCLVGNSEIEALLEEARKSPRQRARLLLHTRKVDHLHEMIIALRVDSFDRPHINFKSAKSFLALKGVFAVVFFLNEGEAIQPKILSADGSIGSKMIRLNVPVWHTIVPLDGPCVFLETIMGPFEGNKFAPFSPEVSNTNLFLDFKKKVRNCVYEFSHRQCDVKTVTNCNLPGN